MGTIKIQLVDLWNRRSFIYKMAKNDFKMKYAGSQFGILWAFVQPIITILLFWFVFQVGLRSVPIDGIPFILWFSSGLIPWFFYSEAFMSATNSYNEYSYLVKKVYFKIGILPLIKILSAFFVHVVFVIILFIIFGCYGYLPTIYSIQIIYYIFCMTIFIFASSLISSSITVFFKDAGQVVGIIVQFSMWTTPIMWNYEMLPESLSILLKANPLFYIINGFRDAMINKIWFWTRINEGLWFWNITLLLLFIGIIVFRKLKPHFSDVL